MLTCFRQLLIGFQSKFFLHDYITICIRRVLHNKQTVLTVILDPETAHNSAMQNLDRRWSKLKSPKSKPLLFRSIALQKQNFYYFGGRKEKCKKKKRKPAIEYIGGKGGTCDSLWRAEKKYAERPVLRLDNHQDRRRKLPASFRITVMITVQCCTTPCCKEFLLATKNY